MAELHATPPRLAIDAEGWVSGVERVSSPNCDRRPAGEEVDLLVIHGISLPAGEFGTPYVEQLFTNRLTGGEEDGFEMLRNLRVSAHLFVRRDGHLVQYVPLESRAWHAGLSAFEGRERCNDFSIGIELEGADEVPYTDEQYRQLKVLIHCIREKYPRITEERIVGHSEIAPGRKSDPGPAFEWERLFRTMESVE